MFILALLFPFLGFVIATGLGRWSGKKGAALMSCVFMLLTNLVACLIWIYVFLGKSELEITIFDWISIDFLSLTLYLMFDSLTANMMVVVTTISALVHIYSVSYMSEDPHLPRFMGLLSLFTFFMIWLITSSSLVQLFVGWEGVGVVSYLLVNFWYTRLAANRSAMMALLTNRVGDWGYSLGMFALIAVIGSLDFSTWFGVSWGYNSSINEIITLLLVIGVIGKSSQIGLHTWLPWAMEGRLEKRALLINKSHYMREHPENLSFCFYNYVLYLIKNTKKLNLIIRSTIAITSAIFNDMLSYFGKILIYGQFAENQIQLLGFSETTRESFQHVKPPEDKGVYSQYTSAELAQQFQASRLNATHSTQINLTRRDFLYWLIGFTEGDGSFIVNKTGYLEFKITQSSVDCQILFYIKKKLGFGSVSVQDKNNGTHQFRVREKLALEAIINIFNGNIATEKTLLRFTEFVHGYNLIYKTNITVKKELKMVTLTDAWLTGFTDAEGCFNVTITAPESLTTPFSEIPKKAGTEVQLTTCNLQNTRIRFRYILSLKGEKPLLTNLSLLLNGKVSLLKSYNGYNMAVSTTNLGTILTYLKKYPLKTKKSLALLRFLKAHKLAVLNNVKLPLNLKIIEKIKILKVSINK